MDYRGIQAQSHGRIRPVEPVVVQALRNDAVRIGVCRKIREGSRNQRAHQQPGDRAVTIGKHGHRTVALTGFALAFAAEHVCCRQAGLDAFGHREVLGFQPHVTGRCITKEPDGLLRHPEMLAQKVRVTGGVKVSLALRLIEPGQHVRAGREEALECSARRRRNRKAVHALGQCLEIAVAKFHFRQQQILTIGGGIEPGGGSQAVAAARKVELEVFEQTGYVNAQFRHQSLHDLAEVRVLQVDRAAPSQPHGSALVKFVASGVTAEIVVVVEEQHARIGAVQLAVEMRCSQPADAGADHHQVVSRIDRDSIRTAERPALTRQRMCPLAPPWMGAAHAGAGRRIVTIRGDCRPVTGQRAERHAQRRGAQADVVNEVPAGDGPMQAELAI